MSGPEGKVLIVLLKDLIEDRLESLQKGEGFLGMLQYAVIYEPDRKILEVKITSAKHLKAMDLSGTSDPYVIVSLLPDKHKAKTCTKHKTLNPVWNEALQFLDLSMDQLRTKTLALKVMDHDKLSRDDPIGELIIPLEQFDISNAQSQWKALQPCSSEKKFGCITIGLTYIPKDGKLFVQVFNCKDLIARDIATHASDPYVKVWLLYQSDKVDKRKTSIKFTCLNPVYNQIFDFSIPAHRIKDSGLLISVKDYDRFGRNDRIGGLLLSTRSGYSESQHWKDVFHNLNEEITRTHNLRGLEKLEKTFTRRKP